MQSSCPFCTLNPTCIIASNTHSLAMVDGFSRTSLFAMRQMYTFLSKNKSPILNKSQFLVYQTEDGKLKIDVRFEGDTVWLVQQQMAELFQTTKQNISLHIQNIYEEQELDRGATVKESLTVQQEGNRSVRRRVELFNLDVIISVGYRVKSNKKGGSRLNF